MSENQNGLVVTDETAPTGLPTPAPYSEPTGAEAGDHGPGGSGRYSRIGQDIRCHHAFSGAVRCGCRAPEVTIRAAGVASRGPRTTNGVASAQPPLGPSCRLEHAGECW